MACCWASIRSSARPFGYGGAAGKPAVVDGPFTEAKEFIGGYFLLDCQTLEQARAYAEQCPAAEWATIEIREVGPCYD